MAVTTGSRDLKSIFGLSVFIMIEKLFDYCHSSSTNVGLKCVTSEKVDSRLGRALFGVLVLASQDKILTRNISKLQNAEGLDNTVLAMLCIWFVCDNSYSCNLIRCEIPCSP